MYLYILSGVIIVLLLYIIITFNGLVKQRNMVLAQKSQIDIELQRRFDLIPNLVEVVKGYAAHEKQTLEDLIEARNNYLFAQGNTDQGLTADHALSGALSRLFMLSENYPDLKANTTFMSLQQELANTEKKIAFARQFYNDAVYKLNTKIEIFPSNVIAAVFRFKKQPFFQTTDTERAPVNVKL